MQILAPTLRAPIFSLFSPLPNPSGSHFGHPAPRPQVCFSPSSTDTMQLITRSLAQSLQHSPDTRLWRSLHRTQLFKRTGVQSSGCPHAPWMGVMVSKIMHRFSAGPASLRDVRHQSHCSPNGLLSFRYTGIGIILPLCQLHPCRVRKQVSVHTFPRVKFGAGGKKGEFLAPTLRAPIFSLFGPLPKPSGSPLQYPTPRPHAFQRRGFSKEKVLPFCNPADHFLVGLSPPSLPPSSPLLPTHTHPPSKGSDRTCV